MTSAQLNELERVIFVAAAMNAVAQWPAHRLEQCPEAQGETDTAVVIRKVANRIALEMIKELPA
jgi:hypothetical protein